MELPRLASYNDAAETFRNCTSLRKVTLGKRISSMGTGVFSGCTNLQQIIIKDGCSVIASECFNGCNDIQTITNYCVELPTTASDAFSSYTAALYVPEVSFNQYKTTEPWSKFGTIGTIEGGVPDPEPKKVSTPTITYQNGKLMFLCETEGAEFVSEITDTDIKQYGTAEIDLTVTYNISVYATRTGMDDSDVARATLCWIDVEPNTEGVDNSIAKVAAHAVLVRAEKGQVVVTGLDDGTSVSIYTMDGRQSASGISQDGQAVMAVSESGVIIVKIGGRAIKVVMR